VQEAIQKHFGGKTPDRSVNPDEAVALGAAIQAGVLGGEVKDLLLLDVTPLSLGIETLGEVFTKIIERNTTIPNSKTQTFSTATDGQTSVEIHVLQGERGMAKDNKSLGKFQLTGIPPAPRGVPQIEVTFEVDANGILQVSARDKGTGRQQSIRITNTGNLSDSEIERMRQEADLYREDDIRRKQLAELRNQAEALFNSYEMTLRDHADVIDANAKTRASDKVAELRAAIADRSISVEAFKEAIDELQQALMEIGAMVYQQASDDEPTAYEPVGTAPPPSTAPEDDMTQEYDLEREMGMGGIDDDDYSFDNDETVTADYEAVD
jgi:molecular chaperone DnaK